MVTTFLETLRKHVNIRRYVRAWDLQDGRDDSGFRWQYA